MRIERNETAIKVKREILMCSKVALVAWHSSKIVQGFLWFVQLEPEYTMAQTPRGTVSLKKA